MKKNIMKIIKNDHVEIDPNQQVTITYAGNEVILRASNYIPHKATTRKIDRDHYVVESTGETKQVKHHASSRLDSIESTKKSMNRLRLLISANFFGQSNEKFITFTFKKPVTNTKLLKSIWRNFLKRLKRHYNLTKSKYIVIFEPQGRLIKAVDGYQISWHIHLLLKGPPYIDIKLVSQIWGLGLVNLKSMNKFKTNNLAAYLTGYATSLDLANVDDMVKKAIKINHLTTLLTANNKKIAKGARLLFYPPYFHFYSCSKGIIYPKTVKKRFNSVDTKQLGEVVSKHSTTIVDDDGQIVNRHQYINYKKGV